MVSSPKGVQSAPLLLAQPRPVNEAANPPTGAHTGAGTLRVYQARSGSNVGWASDRLR